MSFYAENFDNKPLQRVRLGRAPAEAESLRWTRTEYVNKKEFLNLSKEIGINQTNEKYTSTFLWHECAQTLFLG